MPASTETGFIEMRVTKVVGFGPPMAEDGFECVVLDEVSGNRQLVIQIGVPEAFWLGAHLQGLRFGRPMTCDLAAALVRALDGQVRQVRVDRLLEGAVAATVEVGGPSGVRQVDARASDALNLAVVSAAPVWVSPEVVADGERRRQAGSPEAALLRHALSAPPMRVMKAAG